MSKLFSNALIITVMLVALVGQVFAASSMASAMSCEMAGEQHMSHMSMSSMMDHSSMGHDNMMHSYTQNGDDMADDCCEVTCFCPTNACTSVTLVNMNTSAAGIAKVSEEVNSLRIAQPNSISTSLFRPPIFA
ncbi:hypothetical protein [Pseudoalteromonas pernae]|uniref:hypothetical protein n=1 Tax=Pseudoalteromonas pernae TaxID=3118054 RepID=UPI003241F2D4